MADGQDSGQVGLDANSNIDPGIMSLAQGLAQAQGLAHSQNPFAPLAGMQLKPEYAKETQKQQFNDLLAQTLTHSIGGSLSNVQDVQNNAAITQGLVNSMHGQDTGLPDLWSSPIESAGKLFQAQQQGALGYAKQKAGIDIAKQEALSDWEHPENAAKRLMYAQAAQNLGQNGSGAQGSDSSQNLLLLPQDQQTEAIKELKKNTEYNQSLGLIKDAFTQAKNTPWALRSPAFNKPEWQLGANALGIKGASDYGNSTAQLLDSLKQIAGSLRMNPQELGYLQGFIPTGFESNETLDTKMKGLEAAIHAKVEGTPMLDALKKAGIDLKTGKYSDPNSQTATKNGITYKKVAGGWVPLENQ